MNLENLQLFLEAASRGSFAAVARDHGKAPSSVSRAVTALEQRLGVRLLQRSTRRLQLTEAGKEYFHAVEEAMEAISRAGERAQALTETPRGRLRVTASATFGQIGIVPLLPDFMALYPQLDLELLLTDIRLDLLAERIDVAIRLGPLVDSSLIATKLGAVSYHVCASPKYLNRHGMPSRVAELAERDCLHLTLPEFNVWQFRDAKGRIEKVAVKGRMACSNVRALQQCALSGLGICLLPRWIVQRELAAGELVELFPELTVGAKAFEVPVWLLYPSREHLPLKVRVFIDHVKECLRKSPPWGPAIDGDAELYPAQGSAP